MLDRRERRRRSRMVDITTGGLGRGLLLYCIDWETAREAGSTAGEITPR